MNRFRRLSISVLSLGFAVAALACASAEEERLTPPRPNSGNLMVVLKEKGGFAFRRETYILNSNDLSQEKRTALTKIVSESSILKGIPFKPSGAADAIEYNIQVSENELKHEAQFDDATITETCRKLVDFVHKNGKRDPKANAQK